MVKNMPFAAMDAVLPSKYVMEAVRSLKPRGYWFVSVLEDFSP
tara:strand:- start:766 stop:894 length:129 start_codon:yes stop_codon:yes gene_type:complete